MFTLALNFLSMRQSIFLILFFLVTIYSAFSQDEKFMVYTIPVELKENANAVVRHSDLTIDLNDFG